MGLPLDQVGFGDRLSARHVLLALAAIATNNAIGILSLYRG